MIENLWKDFKQLFDKKTGLNPDFSFNEMAIEIRELLGDGKGVSIFCKSLTFISFKFNIQCINTILEVNYF